MIKAQQGTGPWPARYQWPIRSAAPLRYWVLVGVVGLALMYTPSPADYDHRLVNAVWSVGHAGLFFLVTVVALRGLLRRFSSFGQGLIVILAGLLVVASVSELMQLWVPDRTAAWDDWRDNLLGIALGLLLSPHVLERVSEAWRTLWVSLGSLLAVVLVFPLWLTLADIVHARGQFPVLVDFSQPSERWRVSENGPRIWSHNDEARNGQVLETRIGPEHAGIGLHNLAADWRGFSAVAIRLAVEEPVTVTVRIHDAAHERHQQPYRDRFNRRYDLEPGWQILRIPMTDIEQAPSARTMDLARMRRIGLFNLNLTKEHRVWVDEVRLELQHNP